MKVVLAETAWTDLLHIGLAIREHNPTRAASFVDELYDRCKKLGEMPYAYPLLRDHEATGIRRRVHGNYLIFYRVEDDTVQIIHILHGAMDYERFLFSEG
jgi:toxin ParE1/3/4